MDTVAEKLQSLFKRYPYLADGEHDKDLIAKYLEVYHNHLIPVEVLNQIPSFETIRRTRQYYTAELEAAATAAGALSTEALLTRGVEELTLRLITQGCVVQPAPPMIKRLGGLEPNVYGVRGDLAVIGLVRTARQLLESEQELKKVLDFLGWIRQYPGLDRKPVLLLVGQDGHDTIALRKNMEDFGWAIEAG